MTERDSFLAMIDQPHGADRADYPDQACGTNTALRGRVGEVIEPTAPFPDDEVKRIPSLPAAEPVEDVRKELRRRNPNLDGTFIPTPGNNTLTRVEFSTRLSALRGMPLKPLNVRNDTQCPDRDGPVFWSLDRLGDVNSEPPAEILKNLAARSGADT